MLGALWARLFPAPAEILLDLTLLPLVAEEPADSEEHDAGDGDADTRSEHRPLEPPGVAVVAQIDEEPHHAERNPDPENDEEDPLTANVSPSFFERLVHGARGDGCRGS